MEILTVTLNPALDISTHASHVTAGPKLRCDRPDYEPGGGGINVSRAISLLGATSRAFVAVGGAIGALFEDLLRLEGIDFSAFPIHGETRQSLAVTSRETGEQFRFVLPGPDWTAPMIETLRGVIEAEVGRGMLVVASGSLPPGIPPSFYTDLNRTVMASEGRLILDTSGRALAHVMAAALEPLFALRMDGAEAMELAGHSLITAPAIADFGQSLIAKGVAEHLVIGFGAGGNVGVSKDRRILAIPPAVTPVSKVGAGDSFVAAFTLSMARNETLAEAVAYGTAAATSAVTTPGTQLCEGDAARLYLSQMSVTDC